jgi:hypothetical protein
LLGDAQDVEELGDGQARIAVDEVQHPVVGPAEAVIRQDPVGIAHEIPVGEEQELDQVVAAEGRRCGARDGLGREGPFARGCPCHGAAAPNG